MHSHTWPDAPVHSFGGPFLLLLLFPPLVGVFLFVSQMENMGNTQRFILKWFVGIVCLCACVCMDTSASIAANTTITGFEESYTMKANPCSVLPLTVVVVASHFFVALSAFLSLSFDLFIGKTELELRLDRCWSYAIKCPLLQNDIDTVHILEDVCSVPVPVYLQE